MRYKVTELSKRSTWKMIYNVKEHMEERGVAVYDNLKGIAPQSLNGMLNVCSICYSIVITEYDLITTECKLAQIQGKPITTDLILSRAWRPQEDGNAVMEPRLHQWRIIIYLDHSAPWPLDIRKENVCYTIQYNSCYQVI